MQELNEVINNLLVVSKELDEANRFNPENPDSIQDVAGYCKQLESEISRLEQDFKELQASLDDEYND